MSNTFEKNDVEYHLKWMTHALILAEKADALNEVPVGAVLVLNDEVIGEGYNQPIHSHDPTAHAEIVALRQAGIRAKNYRLPNTTLYVTIEPCSMCLGAIVHSRIGHIVFGAPEPKAGVLQSNSQLREAGIFNHEFTWQGGVMEDQCSLAIQNFFKRRRKEKKAGRDI